MGNDYIPVNSSDEKKRAFTISDKSKTYYFLTKEKIVSLKELGRIGKRHFNQEWIFGGLSKALKLPFVWLKEYLFAGKAVKWHRAVEYKAERDTFGFPDSNVRCVDHEGNLIDWNGKKVKWEDYNGGIYLPTKEELNQGYESAKVIGGFQDNWHWSSSSHLRIFAYEQNFYNGVPDVDFKTNHSLARPVRSLLKVNS